MSRRTTDGGGALNGRDETDPRGVSVERPNNPQPQFRAGGGGGDRMAGGDERSFNPASLMDASMCDFSGMLVPCALKGSFEAHIGDARSSNPALGLFWDSGLWAGVGYSTVYLLLFEHDPEALMDMLNGIDSLGVSMRFLPGKEKQPRRPRGRGTPRDTDWQSKNQRQYTVRNACKEMAKQAQRLANEAMEMWHGDKAAALIRFDNEFSRFYLGHEGLGSMTPAAFNDAKKQAAFGAVLGGEGFKPQYKDSHISYGDQTHHFAAHFTAGINKAWLTSTAHKLTDTIPYFYNAGDRRLTNAAYNIGADLRNDRQSLWSIGDRILADICDP